MKTFGFWLFLVFCTGCSSSQNYVVKHNDTEPTQRQRIIIEEIKKDNEIMLFLDGGFKNDRISIVVDKEEKYNDKVSTDNTIGSAKSYTFLRTDKKVKVLINEHIVNLDMKSQYPFMSIDLIDNVPIIEYRKVFLSYE